MFLLDISIDSRIPLCSLIKADKTPVRQGAIRSLMRKKQKDYSNLIIQLLNGSIFANYHLSLFNVPIADETGETSPKGLSPEGMCQQPALHPNSGPFPLSLTDLTSVHVFMANLTYVAQRLPGVCVPVGCASFATQWSEGKRLHFQIETRTAYRSQAS